MKYELFDLIGCVWATGGLYLTIALLSQTLFGKVGYKDWFVDVVLIALWPLLFFSPNGRKKIIKLIKIL